MIHFNGQDFGPLPDDEYNELRVRMNRVAASGGGYVGWPERSVGDISSTCVRVSEFFWTPGAPLSFTHIPD
ncbi:hypothetical protein [Bifidobacterium olomucense]|nr:hypothetical protein [Bifidobacterium sp. DSM 109959]